MGLWTLISRLPPLSGGGGEAWADGMGPHSPEPGPAAGQQPVEGGHQLGTVPQVLQHMGVCSHDAGCICVTHQDPEEQQVGGAEARAGPSLQDSRSA